MIDTITQNTFTDAMIKNGFSYEGTIALFDYLEELENDTETKIEFDPVSLRCEYDEYENLKEVQENIKDKIIHISFDIDVLDPTFAKSTGTTVVNGLTVSDIYMILNNITKNNLIASCDFVEYNPELGHIKEKERTLNCMELSINTVIKNLWSTIKQY